MLTSEHVGKFLKVRFYDHWHGVGKREGPIKVTACGLLRSIDGLMATFNVWDIEDEDSDFCEDNKECFGILVATVFDVSIFEEQK